MLGGFVCRWRLCGIAIEYLIERLKSEIEKATENYNTIYEQSKSYQSELTNELNHLQSLSTELEEAKIQEMSTM